jgi:predicted P-loop ATPase/5S rRNA maturation endonuclease (ribonuclease M5)
MAQPSFLSGSAHERAVAIVERCGGGRKGKDGWKVCCPAHDDQEPSLSIALGDKEGTVVLHCFAGCTTEAIVTTLGLTMRDLHTQTSAALKRRIIATYDYHDVHGHLLHQTVRYEPKTFRQRRPDPTQPGHYLWNLDTIDPVLYHLPAVVQAIQTACPIYIVEGEKDADLLTERGLVATCNPMGVGKWHPSYSTMLQGAHVIILADYDAPGVRHARDIAHALLGIARSVKLIESLHTETRGSDIGDWIAAGGGREEFDAIVQQTPLFDPTGSPPDPIGWSSHGSHPPPSSRPGTSTLPHAAANAEGTQWYDDKVRKYRNKQGIIEANDTTICAFLRNHPHWQGKLWWNDLANRPMVEDAALDDHMLTRIGEYFGEHHNLPIRTTGTKLAKCIAAVCQDHKRDPLQEYLHTLPGWDMVPRLDEWLLHCSGAPDTPYHRFVSRILIVSMIARAYEPGCLYRYVVVFQGPEEYRKSTFVAQMVPYPEWQDTVTESFESKDMPALISALWVAELSELDSLPRTEETRLKSFISKRADSYVPKWGLFRVSPPRRTIFIGTTNEPTWIKGQTGNTRWLPVKIFHPMDVELFVEQREQLYAEAITWYGDHLSDWWRIPAEADEEAKAQREERRIESVYESTLGAWVAKGRLTDPRLREAGLRPVDAYTTWEEIAVGYLKMDTPERWKDMALQKQVGTALKALGWYQVVTKDAERNSIRVWKREEPLPF